MHFHYNLRPAGRTIMPLRHQRITPYAIGVSLCISPCQAIMPQHGTVRTRYMGTPMPLPHKIARRRCATEFIVFEILDTPPK